VAWQCGARYSAISIINGGGIHLNANWRGVSRHQAFVSAGNVTAANMLNVAWQ